MTVGTKKEYNLLNAFMTLSKNFHDLNHLSTLYDIPQSDVWKYHSPKNSISRNIKLQMEVKAISYTAPSYFFDKIHQNKKLRYYVYQLVIKQNAPREIKAQEKWKTTLLEDYFDWKYMYDRLN